MSNNLINMKVRVLELDYLSMQHFVDLLAHIQSVYGVECFTGVMSDIPLEQGKNKDWVDEHGRGLVHVYYPSKTRKLIADFGKSENNKNAGKEETAVVSMRLLHIAEQCIGCTAEDELVVMTVE